MKLLFFFSTLIIMRWITTTAENTRVRELCISFDYDPDRHRRYFVVQIAMPDYITSTHINITFLTFLFLFTIAEGRCIALKTDSVVIIWFTLINKYYFLFRLMMNILKIAYFTCWCIKMHWCIKIHSFIAQYL